MSAGNSCTRFIRISLTVTFTKTILYDIASRTQTFCLMVVAYRHEAATLVWQVLKGLAGSQAAFADLFAC